MTDYDFDPDEYIPRECECEHAEHAHPTVGPRRCTGTRTVYVTTGCPPPDGGTPTHTHERARAGGLTAYTVPCRCTGFREYEGPGEPPDA